MLCPECKHERAFDEDNGSWFACDNPRCEDYNGLVDIDELEVSIYARRGLVQKLYIALHLASEDEIQELTTELVKYNADIRLAKELVKA
jgi:hypothetical protein